MESMRPDPIPTESAASPRSTPDSAQVQVFQQATRDLIGIALRSLEEAGDGVPLSQMRLLLALWDLGRCPSSQVAAALGLAASSVTRLADRLAASGLLERGSLPDSRRVVTLELTALGREQVARVLEWREQELKRVLGALSPQQRAATADGLRCLHRAVAGDAGASPFAAGPVPL
ncbi:MarR family winged helix-turn-helix transcriptional regulator [Phaeacidiphilus oryzae]|uniref:MarR family winged helix-turn-helix transcriptional regulator n=1 Tax=Phaeacidiphilus oryzae TaxID=348818 RepID=UPI00190F8294|nr:MarR family winged helix-turn-helix transcriptional regulator [Phaeacidiphilus oryzae]